jgi:hypothetical protein
VRARTADLYRVKKEVRKLNPFAYLAFPVLTSPKQAPECPSFGDEFLPRDTRDGVGQSRFVPVVSDYVTHVNQAGPDFSDAYHASLAAAQSTWIGVR